MASRSAQRQTLDSRLLASKRVAGPPKWQLRLWLERFVPAARKGFFTAEQRDFCLWVEERIKEELDNG